MMELTPLDGGSNSAAYIETFCYRSTYNGGFRWCEQAAPRARTILPQKILVAAEQQELPPSSDRELSCTSFPPARTRAPPEQRLERAHSCYLPTLC